jgi:hypothetical protein
MIILRRFAVVAGSTLTAAVIGLAGAGAASASSTSDLCVVKPVPGTATYCVWAQGLSKQAILKAKAVSVTNWVYPTGNGYREIYQAHTNLCLQLDAAAHNAVIEGPCIGAKYQEWEITGGFTQFHSEYNTHLCLSMNASTKNKTRAGTLYAATCGSRSSAWYQDFAKA